MLAFAVFMFRVQTSFEAADLFFFFSLFFLLHKSDAQNNEKRIDKKKKRLNLLSVYMLGSLVMFLGWRLCRVC